MYTLIIDCSNFALEHSVHILDSNNNIVGIMHLPTTEIANFIARDSRISSVKLSGAVEYCNGIKEDIENKVALEYANNKRNVEIEVI
jgi:hypothetical protein